MEKTTIYNFNGRAFKIYANGRVDSLDFVAKNGCYITGFTYKDGTKEIKANDKIIQRSRLVYTAFNGYIPKDMVVTFKNGNKKDYSLSNLVIQKAGTTEREKPVRIRNYVKYTKVICSDSRSGFVYEFKSVKDASVYLDISADSIHKHIRCKRKTVKGYVFYGVEKTGKYNMKSIFN